jgi:hypothetical protein
MSDELEGMGMGFSGSRDWEPHESQELRRLKAELAEMRAELRAARAKAIHECAMICEESLLTPAHMAAKIRALGERP